MPLFDPPCDSPPPVDPSIAKVLPSRLCRDHLIAPLNDDGQTLEVALFAPDSLLLADEVKLLTGRQMKPLFAPLSVIERLLNVLYEEGSWTDAVATTTTANFEEVEEHDEFDAEDAAEACEIVHLDQAPPPGRDGRIIRYVNNVFEQALQTGASDIHIEPYRRCVSSATSGRRSAVRNRSTADAAYSTRSSVVSKCSARWTSPNADCHKTVPSDCEAGINASTCGSTRAPPSTAKRS